jgi:dienelactone hydrolase
MALSGAIVHPGPKKSRALLLSRFDPAMIAGSRMDEPMPFNLPNRITGAWRKARHFVSPSDTAWSAAAWALFGAWTIMVLWFFAAAVLPDFSFEKLLGLVVLFGVLAAASAALLLFVWLGSGLRLAYRIALFLILPPLALFMMATWSQGAAIGVTVFILGISLFFGAGATLAKAPENWRSITTVCFLIGALAIAATIYEFVKPEPDLNPSLANYHLRGHTLPLPDPGKPGPYKVTLFTYGSGKDLRRPEYAGGIRFVTRSVDGSKLDRLWSGPGGWLRSHYWGFDAAHMPLQGRVWMPGGAGPFPLVLIVHGNHMMEDYSDPGYAYLGELLASQGFIVVSIDENFLNLSLADYVDPFALRMGDENKVRGWLLLKHLAQWRTWNADAKSPLHGKVDMDRIALVGHSRGGEAVAIANAFNDLNSFPDDALIKFDFHFHLRAIAAIAPVDGQYDPDGRPTPMHDQNYFVIQGNMDGDLTSFMGSSQYSRATFTPGSDGFKASLYVKGANHGQFNTDWGRNDFGLPYKFLLDERQIIPADAQQRIAKVYLSAFLQTTLQGKAAYRQLFEDPRNGAGWLPDDYLVSNYADARTTWLATYEEDIDPSTGSMPGVKIDGANLTAWRESYVSLKYTPLDSHVALIAWDNRVYKRGANYRIDLPNPLPPPENAALVFSASQAEIPTLPDTFGVRGGSRNPDKKPLDWTIVLTDADGETAHLPLSHDQVLYPQVKGETRRISLIDTAPRSEIVMRRFRFPLADFQKENPKLNLARLAQIRFDFDRSKRGAIALDDVGLR